MQSISRRPVGLTQRLLELFIVLAAFSAAAWADSAFSGLPLDSVLLADEGWSMLASILTFWFLAQCDDERSPNAGSVFFLAGLILIIHAMVAYLGLAQPASLVFLVGGSLLAGTLVVLERRWAGMRSSLRGIIVVGSDPPAMFLLPLLPPGLLGVLAADSSGLPAHVPYLGSAENLAQQVAARRPSQIVLAMKDWSRQLSPSLLMDCRLAGISVRTATTLYEELLSRVCFQARQPYEFLFSRSSSHTWLTLIGQAVYSNLLGLVLLLCVSPILLVAALLVAAFSGPGPVLEQTTCLGYQGIPFKLTRFRIHRTNGARRPTAIGSILARLHLVNLPQMLNVVRGEMALVGPRPVTQEFALRMNELIPYHLHRFSVKPGITGWEQLHLRNHPALPDEFLRLEYDFYYLENLSLVLDTEILIRTVFSFLPWSKSPANTPFLAENP